MAAHQLLHVRLELQLRVSLRPVVSGAYEGEVSGQEFKDARAEGIPKGLPGSSCVSWFEKEHAESGKGVRLGLRARFRHLTGSVVGFEPCEAGLQQGIPW